MNWEHFKTFLWLRWRILSNRNRRAGTASVVLQGILMVIAALAGSLAFIGGIAVGYVVFPQVTPANLMLVWDGVVLAFLFFWMTELLVELQRSELLSLDKFLHLPVSLGSAFMINYVGSISSVGVIVFIPLMLGMAIGLVFSKGAGMLLLFPLIAAFALMVTALTHQFRGWLASLMVNQRRRRTIISVATLVFILLVQTPNIITFGRGRWPGSRVEGNAKQIQALDRSLAAGEISSEEHRRQMIQLRRSDRRDDWQLAQQVAGTVNKVVPLGWLPYGVSTSFEGNYLPGVLGTLGLALIGAGSLRRSYRTTMRLYTGHYSAQPGATRAATAVTGVSSRAAPATAKRYGAAFLERQISGLSEYASAITFASLRAMMRAPEAKLMLLSPVIMVFVFGGMFFGDRASPPELMRPLMASGGFTFIFFMMLGMVGNQFSFDRSGFRAYVLSPVPRKDILLGKNLSMAPFVITFMTLTALLFQWRYPMRPDHFIAVLVQMLPMYLVFCLVGNILSIIAPMPVAAGSMKPVKPKATTILIHTAFIFLFPLALSPTLIPLAIEFLLSRSESLPRFPAYLMLAIGECILVIWLYPQILQSQGNLLERRERRILEIVTSKVE
ncbi:MAG TPA: ABC transporter permease [Terriglobia bacterium]|nr:ABC transporter permease [Terriglobia bacterium]